MALVALQHFFNSFEAGMAKGRLDAAGIPSIILGMEMSAAITGGMFNIRLMVDEEDFDDARALLAEEP